MSESAPNPLRPERSGVYRAPDDVRPLRRQAGEAGLAWFAVDLAPVAEKVGFLLACAERLAFPETFGRNWDALADCLQDLSWRPAAGYVVHFQNAAVFAVASKPDWAIAVEILNQTATFWKERGKTFLALVHGAQGLPPFEP